MVSLGCTQKGVGEGRGLANALLSLAVQAKEDQKLLHY